MERVADDTVDWDRLFEVVTKELMEEFQIDLAQIQFVLFNEIDADNVNGIYYRYYERLDELAFGKEESA